MNLGHAVILTKIVAVSLSQHLKLNLHQIIMQLTREIDDYTNILWAFL